MKKLGIIILFLFIITTNPVYSLSLFPKVNEDSSLLTLDIASLKEVHISNNIIELVLESNSNYKIDGIIVNINSKDNIIINKDLNPYETKIYQINTNDIVDTIEIRFYNDNNHNRNVINQIITYRITGNEENIIQQQEQILIQENQQIQQEFNNNPSYISYSSYSKLDDNKNIIYFTKDHISSNRITTNQQGNIEFQANYMPYGKIFKEEGQEQYKYSNKELDNSNLYYFGARYYDPSIGRFTQVDPIFKSSESPYMYANNNPIRYVDPTGKQTIDPVAAPADATLSFRRIESIPATDVVASLMFNYGIPKPMETSFEPELTPLQRAFFQEIETTPIETLDSLTKGHGRSAKAMAHYLSGNGEPMEFQFSNKEWKFMLKQTEGIEWTPTKNPEYPASEGWEYITNIEGGPRKWRSISDAWNLLGFTTLRRRWEPGIAKYHYMIAGEKFDFVQGNSNLVVNGGMANRFVNRFVSRSVTRVFRVSSMNQDTEALQFDIHWLARHGSPFPIVSHYYTK